PLALTYAEVEYDKIWDVEVLEGKLDEYDWLHLHHEDFTGQFGKFWANYRNMPWYIAQVKQMEAMAAELGYSSVSEQKKDVAHTIKEYVGEGGFLFAMCSGTDTFDIALAAEGVDIAPEQFDGDPADPNAQQKLDFDKTLAFENFEIKLNPAEYEHANIDVPVSINRVDQSLDFFTLFDFSAKWDPVPTMLTQNHVSSVRGFYGQTTAFQKDKVKSSVVILGESPGREQVKYIHGNYGNGTFTFYAGHDPEDYTHRVNDPPTDLELHPNSPGYRLILNNILFPRLKKRRKKRD
ncbi:MAG TPA: asparagine synthetase B, partial [Balneolaceae bacterium]|nr:asparagine synthetase B [Balneolaceae bacterium]